MVSQPLNTFFSRLVLGVLQRRKLHFPLPQYIRKTLKKYLEDSSLTTVYRQFSLVSRLAVNDSPAMQQQH